MIFSQHACRFEDRGVAENLYKRVGDYRSSCLSADRFKILFMKKYFFGSMGFLFVILASAFITTNESNSKIKTEDPLYWFDPSGVSYDGFRVKGDILTSGTQVYYTGCAEDEFHVECERGFTEDKLIDPDHPEYGVDPLKLDEYSDMIYKEEN